ncbi:S-adenosyl-L-methionine-dependent methyltransferase [Umbelopsis sp. PMI_123]|nr:S-adenosyl-L-methionine-dependent methyltransferase [Umbelopsis sp. PMI_123]
MGNNQSVETPRHASLPTITTREHSRSPGRLPRSVSSNTSSNSSSGFSKFSSMRRLSADTVPTNAVHPLQQSSRHLSPYNISADTSRRTSSSSSRRPSPNPSLIALTTPSPELEKYVWVAGRRFHNVEGSEYLFPCDDEEIDRMHVQHFMVRFAIQGNYLAPVSDSLRNGAAVLDVACGPGSWTMEIAGEYPKSEVIGIDMTSMYPSEIKPANCQFIRANIVQPLPFDDASFDYIFMRFVNMGIEAEQWDTVIAELVRVAKPGAWIELVESDVERYRVGPCIKDFDRRLVEVLQARNMDPFACRNLDKLLIKHGLLGVKQTFISSPAGQWAGKLGQLTLQSWKANFEALKPQLCLAWNITHEQYQALIEACLSEAEIHKSYENIHFAYGHKKNADRD